MKLKKVYEVTYFYFKHDEEHNVLPQKVMASNLDEALEKVKKYLEDNKLTDYCEVSGINESFSGNTVLD